MTINNIISDLKSGFFVALIALPLCLGIAIASSYPPIAGLITAIIGGLIATLFVQKNQLTIKGPAAGLIVIMMATVTDLGQGDLALGYKRTLAVGVIAGLIQIIFALTKLARLGRLMPPSVIHGMLAAIGVIIVSKQVHILVGSSPHGKSSFELISEIPQSILNMNPELAFIGIFTLMAMLILPTLPNRYLKSIPPALLALLVVIPLSIYWHLNINHSYQFLDHIYQVGPSALVNIPPNILSSLVFPDFSILASPIAYKYIIILALIGSVESVLTVIAIESMNEKSLKTDHNKDLLGVGIGNFLSSLCGGLPMISEVVRSRANIDSGAKTKWSNFFHGAFLLIAVLWLSPIICKVPLAALAAMLIITGTRLASPSQFVKTYKIGFDQFLLFSLTLLTTLATDLLIGITAGIIAKMVVHLFRGAKLKELFSAHVTKTEKKEHIELSVRGAATFSNFSSLENAINKERDKNKPIILDFAEAKLIDHTTLTCLSNMINDLGKHNLVLSGLDKLKRVSSHHLSTHLPS